MPGTIQGNYQAFHFFATQGQTVFPLGYYFGQVVWAAINGTLQSPLANDFTVTSGNTITTSQGLNAGDEFFGMVIV